MKYTPTKWVRSRLPGPVLLALLTLLLASCTRITVELPDGTKLAYTYVWQEKSLTITPTEQGYHLETSTKVSAEVEALKAAAQLMATEVVAP